MLKSFMDESSLFPEYLQRPILIVLPLFNMGHLQANAQAHSESVFCRNLFGYWRLHLAEVNILKTER